jgi:hypothetical protein
MKKDVDAFLKTYTPDIRKVVLAARQLILAIFPDAIEQVDLSDKLIGYGFDRTYKGTVCALIPYTAHVNLIFSQGTQLPDPHKLLEGSGKYARHIKLKTVADVERSEVKALVKAAIDLKRPDRSS